MDSFDFVIVGGGSAASLLACRLGEAGRTVCVLEAGPSDRSLFIRIPAGYTKTFGDPRLTWRLAYAPCEGTAGRRLPLVQGRVLGGSSVVNGLIYVRGLPSDFDAWAASGNPGWSYEEVLPLFWRIERFLGEDPTGSRGRDGRLPVTPARWRTQACHAFRVAAMTAGVPPLEDLNAEMRPGVAWCQSTIERNERWSAARAFLHPARRSFRIDVRPGATVTSILLDGRRAAGVRYRRESGASFTVLAREWVVLAAGAVNTPKLLQLSGIGPPDLLRRHGIAVSHALPGVGENLQDHYCCRLVARARPGVDTINRRARGVRLAREALSWLIGRPSVLAISPVTLQVFWKSISGLPAPDLALAFTPGSAVPGAPRRLYEEAGLTCGVNQMRPASRGFVRIESPDEAVAPIVQPNFLAEDEDRAATVAALRWGAKLLLSPAMARFVDGMGWPHPVPGSDSDWLEFARRTGTGGHHLVGTARMGPASDPVAVVDHRLRVHGLERLAVADASVMPALPSANTYAPTLMVAEKAADMLLARA